MLVAGKWSIVRSELQMIDEGYKLGAKVRRDVAEHRKREIKESQ